MSTAISETISKRQQLISTGKNNSIPIGISVDKDNTEVKHENDLLFEQLPDLVNQQFKAWYCKMFYRLGKDRVLILASQARADGKNPARLFSYLLRKEAA